MIIKLNTPGKIIKGMYPNWYVYVEELYGGYMILTSNMNNFEGDGKTTNLPGNEGYDNWVENYQSVEFMFENRAWEIEWLG